jgi:SAM-dependent methyltransferase
MHHRIIGLYDENAAAWAALRSGSGELEAAWLQRLAALLKPGAEILDIGCGSGEPLARDLISAGFAVTGIDSSPSLIAICRERFPDQKWIVGDMRALELGARFDGAIAWHSLFHLSPDDQRGMFARLAAHLREGGVLMFTSGDDEGVRVGEWQGEPLYHASLSQEEYRSLLEAAGFEVLDFRPRDPECGGATVWVAQIKPASGLEGSA